MSEFGSMESIHTPPTPDPAEKRFQEPAKSETILPKVSKVMESLAWRRILSVLHAKRWSKEAADSSFFSLRNISTKSFGKDERKGQESSSESTVFDPIVGSVIVDHLPEDQTIKDFFTEDRVLKRDEGGLELRGANYFIALDKERKNKGEKIDVIGTDIHAALTAITKIDRDSIKTKDQFLPYLAIFDYLKLHTMTLFHSLTYAERLNPQVGQENNLMGNGQTYQELRNQTAEFMETYVRMYYEVALGLPLSKQPDLEQDSKFVDMLTKQLKLGTDGDARHTITYPEVNHPLPIIFGAQQTAMKFPSCDLIVGIPSGGTESAVALKMAYQILYNQTPKLSLLPVSMHIVSQVAGSRGQTPINRLPLEKQEEARTEFAKKLATALSQDAAVSEVMNKENNTIMLVDDNSNTGSTLQLLSDTFDTMNSVTSGAEEKKEMNIQAFLVQHDPGRIMRRLANSSRPRNRITRIDHPNYQSTYGTVMLDESGIELNREAIKTRLEKHYASQIKTNTDQSS